ncbi:hypothetical protein G4B88_002084 [Cannabis sativa]|uniref:glucan endo-1,3-beta-D-glucosidase n=1 Tax=Cannabis sativa TaxID=3483 RepID=A0A7J6EY25_CANSA|nr:hypothetical protein G4B88_002084 [Cannabis sativa]
MWGGRGSMRFDSVVVIYSTFSQVRGHWYHFYSAQLTVVDWIEIDHLFSRLGAFVGVNIGTDVSNLPSDTDIVAILKAHQFTHVRLYNADAQLLKALSGSGIEVMVGVTNEEVLGIGESAATAAAWVNKNVAAYMPSTNITAIGVGSEVLTVVPNAASVLVSAMNYLHKALVAANLNFQVKVSTPHSMDIIPKAFLHRLRPLTLRGILLFTKSFSF